MENLNDLYKEFMIKALGENIKVSPSDAEEFFYFCEEKHCIPSRLKELAEKIQKGIDYALKLKNRFYDYAESTVYETAPKSMKELAEYLLSYEDLFEYPRFVEHFKYHCWCRGKYFHDLQVECSLKFVRFWLLEEGLVSGKTFQELEAMGTEKAIIDELKQINEKNILCKQSNHWPSPWN